MRSGIGDWGASVVLIALVTLALVLFTGVTLRAALSGLARAGTELWQMAVPHGDDGAGSMRSRTTPWRPPTTS